MATSRRSSPPSDAARVRTAGDPLPGAGPFEVYRGGRGAGLSWTSDPLVAAYFAEMHIDVVPTIRKALLPAADVYVYFAHFEHDRVTRSRASRTIGLTWLSHRSDEFLAAVDPGGVALEPEEVEALIARVRA